MKKLTLALIAVLSLALPNLLSAQTLLTQTTLSSAISSTSTTTVVVASATGITANTTVIFVDEEAMFVNSVNSTTLGVTRGYNGTQATTHAASAVVILGPPFAFVYQAPSGSCTRSNVLYLPVISFGIGGVQPMISDCVGGQWLTSFPPTTQNSAAVIQNPPTGGTIYTSLNTNGTTLAATTMYCTELDVPYTKRLTGLEVLLGTTGATDKHIAVLYDATGNLLANSATAGITAGTASTYETLAFTAPYYVVGPGRYFGCLQTNGTTATVRMLITSVTDTYLTKGVTGITFGTVPATITVPTTFTTAVGPYMALY